MTITLKTEDKQYLAKITANLDSLYARLKDDEYDLQEQIEALMERIEHNQQAREAISETLDAIEELESCDDADDFEELCIEASVAFSDLQEAMIEQNSDGDTLDDAHGDLVDEDGAKRLAAIEKGAAR